MDIGTQRGQQTGTEFSLARTFPHTRRWSYQTPSSIRRDEVNCFKTNGTILTPRLGVVDAQSLNGDGDDHFCGSDESTEVDLTDIEKQLPLDLSAAQAKLAPYEPTTCSAFNARTPSPPIDSSINQVHPLPPHHLDQPPSELLNPWTALRSKYQRPLAEWLGTTILIFIGCSCNLSVITSRNLTGNLQSVYWCWGFAVMISIYISGGASGAFLNPALTIMLSVFRGLPARRIPTYILAQILGAFTGALLAFAVYRDDILHLDGGKLIPETTGVAFYTQPVEWVRPGTAFANEMLGTAVISCSILALGDSDNSPPGAGMHALVIGLLVTATDMALGYSTGGCFNPARDLGPRVALLLVGYPVELFAAHHNWWIWGPWCATITGALLGALVYDLVIFKGAESPVNYSCGARDVKNFRDVRFRYMVEGACGEIDLEAGNSSR